MNKVDGGCLHGLRRADLQGSEEDAQQKVVDGTCFTLFLQITLTLIEFQGGAFSAQKGGAVVFGNAPPLWKISRD